MLLPLFMHLSYDPKAELNRINATLRALFISWLGQPTHPFSSLHPSLSVVVIQREARAEKAKRKKTQIEADLRMTPNVKVQKF